jgi:N-acyl-D-amino-acid deacylase
MIGSITQRGEIKDATQHRFWSDSMTRLDSEIPILLQGGTLVDGTGAPGRACDVLTRDGRVAAIGSGLDSADALRIDCSGRVVAPGFIDMHSHMDFFAAGEDPHAFDPFTRQGVTSFVAGNCGFSPFGFRGETAHHHLIENGLFEEGCDRIDWSGYPEYRERVAANGVRQKIFGLVGHGTSRTSFCGFDARELTSEELREMLELLGRAMDEGAEGVSLGLQYKPGVFASMEELEAVARLVEARGKLLTVHARAYSTFSGTYPLNPFGRAHNLRAMEDMLELARRTGVRMQYSHLIFVGRRTWRHLEEALELFDRAHQEGLDVHFDIFPYACGATLLNTFLPDWFMARMPDCLDRPLDKLRLRAELALGFSLVGFGYPEMQITNARCPEYAEFDGRFLPEIAAAKGQTEFDTLLDILRCSNVEARVLFHGYTNPEILDRLMAHPLAHFATDAWPESSGVQNPAAYGTFPRFLELARQRGRVSLEQAVHKMTGHSAARLGRSDLGILAEGHPADVTVFDWERIADQTEGGHNDARPTGVEHVYVDGRAILENGEIVASA